jgi:phage-related protein
MQAPLPRYVKNDIKGPWPHAGWLLRRLQRGETLTMPDSRPMPTIGSHCHELRIADRAASKEWRIIYRVDADAVVIADAFAKKSRSTPRAVITRAVRRFRRYDEALR